PHGEGSPHRHAGDHLGAEPAVLAGAGVEETEPAVLDVELAALDITHQAPVGERRAVEVEQPAGDDGARLQLDDDPVELVALEDYGSAEVLAAVLEEVRLRPF